MKLKNHNLHCEVRHINGRPYHIVRPTAVIRIEQWPNMVAWAQEQFGELEQFVPGCVGYEVKVARFDQRVYVDLTRFWFRHETDRNKFLDYWS